MKQTILLITQNTSTLKTYTEKQIIEMETRIEKKINKPVIILPEETTASILVLNEEEQND
jgi:hypothetical protein